MASTNYWDQQVKVMIFNNKFCYSFQTRERSTKTQRLQKWGTWTDFSVLFMDFKALIKLQPFGGNCVCPHSSMPSVTHQILTCTTKVPLFETVIAGKESWLMGFKVLQDAEALTVYLMRSCREMSLSALLVQWRRISKITLKHDSYS